MKSVTKITKSKRWRHICLSLIAVPLIVGLSFVLFSNLYMIKKTAPFIMNGEKAQQRFGAKQLSFSEPNAKPLLVVLGCAVWANGQPSPMLQDRIDSGVEAYQAGIAGEILMSGDRKLPNYDEVGTMERVALEQGVPQEAISLDPKGYSTFDTVSQTLKLQRSGPVFFVTQGYHLYRTVYLARTQGVEAYGISADKRVYAGQIVRDLREWAARSKDFVQVAWQKFRK